jgi:hypothetical protein
VLQGVRHIIEVEAHRESSPEIMCPRRNGRNTCYYLKTKRWLLYRVEKRPTYSLALFSSLGVITRERNDDLQILPKCPQEYFDIFG